MSALPTWLETLLTFITGGGAFAAWTKLKRVFLEGEQQDHDIAAQLRQELNGINDELKATNDELRDEIDTLHTRIEELEIKYDAEHDARIEAEHRQKELSIAVHALIIRVDDLIARLAAHEEISSDERRRLTSVPFINLDDFE
jgi:cell division protein FtsB